MAKLKAKAVKPKRTTVPLRKRTGPKPWAPTDLERTTIVLCVADGMTQEQIAAVMRVDHDTLVRHCKTELETGKLQLQAKVSGKLASKALAGDLGSIVWWEKTRRGLVEASRVEQTGANGGPIDQRVMVAEITPDLDPVTASDAYTKLLG